MTIDRVYKSTNQQPTHGNQQVRSQIPPHHTHTNHHQYQHHSSHTHNHSLHLLHEPPSDTPPPSTLSHPNQNPQHSTRNSTHQIILQQHLDHRNHHHFNSDSIIHPQDLTARHRPNRLPPPPPTSHTHPAQQSLKNDDPETISLIRAPLDRSVQIRDNDAIMPSVNVARNSMPVVPVRESYATSEVPARISLQHNYHPTTHYQWQEPKDIESQAIAVNQFDCNAIVQAPNNDFAAPSLYNQQQYVNYKHSRSTSVTVADASNYNDGNNQDSYTEDVIQAILAAKEALEKPIEERDERDITLIDSLCSLVHGFDMFPKKIRRALAAQAVLIVIDEKGKELIVNDEELDSFCVLIFGQCEQLSADKSLTMWQFSVGDAFGVLEPTTETIRFDGHLITKCENCAFLCVKRHDYYTILTDPANETNKDLIRHRDRSGNVICISKFDPTKKTSGLQKSYRIQTKPFKFVLPDGHILVKATEECLLKSLIHNYDSVDQDYIDDFLLLFRVFMKYEPKDKEKRLPPGMISLCLTLAKWLEDVDYRDKVIKIVLTWLSSYYHDFELNPEFSYLFFRVLESRLLDLSMNNQLHLLHVTLTAKSKIRHVTISRSSREQPLTFSIAGGYEKNCGIFVTHVNGSIMEDSAFDTLKSHLETTNRQTSNTQNGSCHIGPIIPPRRPHSGIANHPDHAMTRFSSQLRPGDQILEVNGTNFSAIKLIEAQKKLDVATHLSLTVRYNPSSFYEMKALPEGRRKSSMSSISSVSPYPTSSQRFIFNPHDNQPNIGRICNDPNPPISPLFSANANFGFRSIIKAAPKSDSVLSNLINSSKQFVRQIRESTANNGSNADAASKASDNISDDQSNDFDLAKTKSNTDIQPLKGKDKQIESGLSNVVRLDDLNPAVITENQTSQSANQTLVNVLRVFNAANNDSRYLLVHEETTAREVVMVAVREFNLTSSASQTSPGDKNVSSLNWFLYEVSVVPESRTIKQKCLSEQTSHLADRASICSRFYIKNNSQSSFGPSKLDMGDDTLVNEILKESPAHITLTSLNATLLAVELTLGDFDKFRGIEPQQFVYDTFFDCSDKHKKSQSFNPNGSLSSQETASLKSSSSDGQETNTDTLHALNKTRIVPNEWMQEYQQFADISNREMFWVICEILNERNIGRRVKIVKQFVRVADVCSQLRNYNSMFAIISGLGHSCVTRLRRTFDKLKPKYKNQLEKMRSLFDPSKNMSNYRMCLSQTQPPAIPLFPQVKKDLTFTKEGRSIFVRESNDISDDEDEFDKHGGMGDFSQDTIKRKSRPSTDLLSVRSATPIDNREKRSASNHLLSIAQMRSVSYTSYPNNAAVQKPSGSDSILINFAEIRQFTERVRNVIHFSSIPYSNDLLTNTKDSQRTQAQIKKMHEEWQMRKRIRHYMSQTLANSTLGEQQPQRSSTSASGENLDQVDGRLSSQESQQRPATLRQQNGRLNITYDERTLHQRSLDVEPELNPRSQVTSSSSRQPHRQHMVTQQQLLMQQQQQQQLQQASQLLSSSSSSSSLLPIAPLPMMLNLQPPPVLPSVAKSSPTLSKSSSLSSCSSFNHNHFHSHQQHLSNLNASRGSTNLTSSLGKFGTESTESLRKLKALSENVDSQWRSSCNNNNTNITGANNNNGNGLSRISAPGGNGPDKGLLSKNLVPSRIFPSKSSR